MNVSLGPIRVAKYIFENKLCKIWSLRFGLFHITFFEKHIYYIDELFQ